MGKTSKEGTTACVACPVAAMYAHVEGDSCSGPPLILCGAGKYNALDSDQIEYRCASCPPGKYSFVKQPNATKSCTVCIAGQFQSKPTQAQCEDCPEGYYQPGAQSPDGVVELFAEKCLACPAGKNSVYKGLRTGAPQCIDGTLCKKRVDKLCTRQVAANCVKCAAEHKQEMDICVPEEIQKWCTKMGMPDWFAGPEEAAKYDPTEPPAERLAAELAEEKMKLADAKSEVAKELEDEEQQEAELQSEKEELTVARIQVAEALKQKGKLLGEEKQLETELENARSEESQVRLATSGIVGQLGQVDKSGGKMMDVERMRLKADRERLSTEEAQVVSEEAKLEAGKAKAIREKREFEIELDLAKDQGMVVDTEQLEQDARTFAAKTKFAKEAIQYVKSEIKGHSCVIFGLSWERLTFLVKHKLLGVGAQCRVIDIDKLHVPRLDMEGIASAIKRLSRLKNGIRHTTDEDGDAPPSWPNIFLGGEYIGGASELTHLLNHGTLKNALIEAGAYLHISCGRHVHGHLSVLHKSSVKDEIDYVRRLVQAYPCVVFTSTVCFGDTASIVGLNCSAQSIRTQNKVLEVGGKCTVVDMNKDSFNRGMMHAADEELAFAESSIGTEVPELVNSTLVLAAPFDACGDLTNAAALSGQVVLVQRGKCDFTTKVRFCQKAGAAGVVVINSREKLVFMRGGMELRPGFLQIFSIAIKKSAGDLLVEAMEGRPSVPITIQRGGRVVRALRNFTHSKEVTLPMLFVNGTMVSHSRLEQHFAEEAGESHPNATKSLSWLTEMLMRSGAYMHVDDCEAKQRVSTIGKGISAQTVSWGTVIYEALLVVVILGAVIALASLAKSRVRGGRIASGKNVAYAQVCS
jgi:glutaredoxin-related protein